VAVNGREFHLKNLLFCATWRIFQLKNLFILKNIEKAFKKIGYFFAHF